MKKIQMGWVFILAILFSGCNTNDHKITQRLLAQQGHWETVADSSGRNVSTRLVFDSAYKTEPTTAQKIVIEKNDGTIYWAYFFLALAVAVIIYGIVKSNNPGKRGSPIVACGCLAVVLAACAAGVINWGHTKENEIPKVTYDSLMKADGNLGAYWKENLFK